jgi:hypothetical protein
MDGMMEINETSEIENEIEKLFFFGVSHLAKALVFRTLAKDALEKQESILASISGYYSLFHLAMALIYFCPQILDEKRRKEIIEAIEKTGGLDPSGNKKSRIKHNELPAVINQCVSRGLDKKFPSLLENGRKLREYVNYGPRMFVKNGFPIFGDCKKKREIDEFITQLDGCLMGGIRWAQDNSVNSEYSMMHALGFIGQFFDDPKLFYLEWCSQDGIEKSKKFLEEIFWEFKKMETNIHPSSSK